MKFIYSFVIGLLLFSCGNNNVGPTVNSENFLPLEEGFYWIYRVTELDSQGNEIMGSTIDSIVAVEVIASGENRVASLHHFKSGQIYDTIEVRKTDKKLEVMYDEDQTKVSEFGEFYALIVDYNDTEWFNKSETLKYVHTDNPFGITEPLEGNFIINSRRLIIPEQIEVLGETYIADIFEENHDSYINDTTEANNVVERFRKFDKSYYFVNQVGLVYYEWQPYTTTWHLNRGKTNELTMEEEFKGIKAELIRYNFSDAN